MTLRGVTVSIEIAHRGVNGIMHGHSLSLEVWTSLDVDLDVFSADVRDAVAFMDHAPLEDTIQARTFEDVAERVLTETRADRVVLRLPSKGYLVEVHA